MKSYINEIVKLDNLREYTVPATGKLFQINEKSEAAADKTKFHSVVAKLLYLGKRGHPDVLMPAQFLCTRIQAPPNRTLQSWREF
jgi:hypothetical protein